MEKVFKNGIVTLTILSLFISPFLSLTQIANAQSYDANGQYYQDGEYGNESQGITGYVTNLAPAITQLPLCKGKLKSGLKNLFKDRTSLSGQDTSDFDDFVNNPPDGGDGSAGGGSSIIDDEGEGLTTGGFSGDKGVGGDLDSSSLEAISESEDVNIYDEQGNKKLDILIGDAKVTKDKVSSLEENDTCLKSIARMVIKMLLQKITVSTIAWIQSGYDGNPAFLEHPGEFFSDIAKTEIMQFATEINDPYLFPFGKEFIISKALSYNRTFQENAQYSLDKLIKSTSPEFSAAEFSEDFGKGGWNAWIGMTAVKQNNALGFQIMAGAELENRIAANTQQIKEELAQAEGYLGDQRCVEPKGVTKASHRAALANPVKVYKPIIFENGGTGTSPEEASIGSYSTTGYYQDSKGYYEIEGACKRWEYVTPGQMIATAATKIVNYPDNNLLKAEDLNDAVAAIIDAWIAKSSSDLMQKGFANLGNEGADGSLIINADEFGRNFIESQVENDFSGASITDWLRKNNNFNIRYDLTQAFIDTQRTYTDKLKDYNDALHKLIRYTYQLDYCIPGPRPDWKEQTYLKLNDLETQVPSEAGGIVETVKGLISLLKAITIYATPIGIGATINVGQTAEGIMSILGQGYPEEVMTRYFYTSWLRITAGLRTAPTYQIGSRGSLVNIIDHIIRGYDVALKRTFTKEKMPDVTSLAASEYRKVEGYKQIIENNLTEMAAMRGIIARLTALKEEVDDLSQTELEALSPDSPIIAKFARMSTNLVDGDTIADVVRLIGQAEDNTAYIYEKVGTNNNSTERGLIMECMEDLDSELEEETNRIKYPANVFVLMENVPYPNQTLPDDTSDQCLPPNLLFQAPSGPDAPPFVIGIGAPCVDDPEDPGSCDPDPFYTEPLCGSVSADGQQVCYTYVYSDPPGQSQGESTYCFDIDSVILLTPGGDVPENQVNIECEVGEIVQPDGSCEANSTFGGGLNILNNLPDFPEGEGIPLDDEDEFNTDIDEYVEDYYEQICEGTIEPSPAVLNNPFYAFGQNTAGFLQHGYYEEGILNDDPRVEPPDYIANQTVKIPKGILNVDAQCPILKFGPSAQQGAKRSIKAGVKSCKKTYKAGTPRNECFKEVLEDAHNLVVSACVTDLQVKNICEYKKESNAGSPASYTDTIRPFEKNFKIY